MKGFHSRIRNNFDKGEGSENNVLMGVGLESGNHVKTLLL